MSRTTTTSAAGVSLGSVATVGRQVGTQAVTHIVDTTVQAPSANSGSAQALIQGLGSVNGALNEYGKLYMQNQAKIATEHGKVRGMEADVSSQEAVSKSLVTPTTPSIVPQAWGANFAEGYKQAMGTKLGGELAAEVETAYNTQKNSEDFDIHKFEQDALSNMHGLEDITVASAVATRLTTVVDSARKDYAQVQAVKVIEQGKANYNASMAETIRPDATGEQNAQAFFNVLSPMGQKMGFITAADRAQLLFEHVGALSLAAHGKSALFDVFDQKDPKTGMTIAEMNPQLRDQIERGRNKAQAAEAAAHEAAMQPIYYQQMLDIENGVSTSGQMPKESFFANQLAQGKSATEVLSMRRKFQDSVDKFQAAAAVEENIAMGNGAAVDPADVKAYLLKHSEGESKVLTGALHSTNPDGSFKEPQKVAAAIASLISKSSATGTSVLNPVLSRFTNYLENAQPSADGRVSPQFMLAVGVYDQLPESRRAQYFSPDASTVASTYLAQRGAGVADAAAYTGAINATSPQGKAAAEKMSKDPKFQADLADTIKSSVMSLYDRNKLVVKANANEWFGGSIFRNANTVDTTAAAYETTNYLKGLVAANPSMSKQAIDEAAQAHAASRYTYVDGVGIVPIPVGTAGKATTEAIGSYVSRVKKQLGTDNAVTLIEHGNGKYVAAEQKNGMIVRVLGGEMSFNDLTKDYKLKSVFTPQEQQEYASFQQRLTSGKVTGEDLSANQTLIAKARSIGALPQRLEHKISSIRQDEWNRLSEAQLKLNLGAPAMSSNGIEGASRGVAQQFLKQANLTAALITTGEAVRLTAYTDPNSSAGKNIGMGYNLNANAATIEADFRKAGIPVERIPDIKAGRASITEQQAMGLLVAVLPRYQQKAADAVNEIRPNSWKTLSEGQKAMLTDVQWQVGDVSQFKTALHALLAGDMVKFNSSIKVKYRANATAPYQEDTRRNSLRSAALAGADSFMRVLSR